jgi:hypothetical protein
MDLMLFGNRILISNIINWLSSSNSSIESSAMNNKTRKYQYQHQSLYVDGKDYRRKRMGKNGRHY